MDKNLINRMLSGTLGESGSAHKGEILDTTGRPGTSIIESMLKIPEDSPRLFNISDINKNNEIKYTEIAKECRETDKNPNHYSLMDDGLVHHYSEGHGTRVYICGHTESCRCPCNKYKFAIDEMCHVCVKAGVSLSESLISTYAQAICKDEVDAALEISKNMTPEDINKATILAKAWRRPKPGWKANFTPPTVTGFKFIDENPNQKVNRDGSFNKKRKK